MAGARLRDAASSIMRCCCVCAAGKKLDVTYVSAADLDASLVGANPWAVFNDLLLKVGPGDDLAHDLVAVIKYAVG